MFALDGRDLPSVNSYEQAVKKFEKSKPFPRCDGDVPYGWEARQLSTNQFLETRMKVKPHLAWAKHPDGRIGMCYHGTMLVMYEPTGTLSVRTWESVSSGIFINRILDGLYVHTTAAIPYLVVHKGGSYWNPESKAYRFERTTDSLILYPTQDEAGRDTWEVDELAAEPWMRYRVNRKEAAKVWADWVHPDFAVWARAYSADKPRPIQKSYGRPVYNAVGKDYPEHISMPLVRQMVAEKDIEKWIAVCDDWGPTIVTKLRQYVMQRAHEEGEPVFDTTTHAYLSTSQVSKAISEYKKFERGW